MLDIRFSKEVNTTNHFAFSLRFSSMRHLYRGTAMEKLQFSFKQKSGDFIVEEHLPYALSGNGDFLYVLFEKRNHTTQDILDHLIKHCGVSRPMLGIAGLKDKKAITRQRITISKRNLQKCGWPKGFVATLNTIARVLESIRHTEPLWMSTPIANVFHIRLRHKTALSQATKTAVLKNLMTFLTTGCANFFGAQRFGIEGRNRKQGKEILLGNLQIREKKELVFKLQAYASKIFNDYLAMRVDKKSNTVKLLDGDIVTRTDDQKAQLYGLFESKTNAVTQVTHGNTKDFFVTPKSTSTTMPFTPKTMQPTGPFIGYNLLCCPPWTAAWKLEQQLFKKYHLTEKFLTPYKQHTIYGLRRSLRVTPFDVETWFQQNDLLITFSLPSGSYASVVIEEMMKRVQRV